MMLINPNYKPHRELGFTDAQWDALKTVVTDYLDLNDSQSCCLESDVRALDAALTDDKTWAQLAGELGLTLVPLEA